MLCTNPFSKRASYAKDEFRLEGNISGGTPRLSVGLDDLQWNEFDRLSLNLVLRRDEIKQKGTAQAWRPDE